MKKQITLSFGLILLFFGLQSKAADTTSRDSSSTAIAQYLSLHVATQGVGLEYKIVPKPAYAFRVGFSVLPFKAGGVYSVGNEPTDVDFEAKFTNIHVMADWHPMVQKENFLNKFLLTAGVAYFAEAKGDAEISYRGDYKYGDIVIPSEDLGKLYGDVKWNDVAPYVGFGFENPFPAKKINVGFALGTYYLGKPTANMTGTKFLAMNTGNKEQLEENLSDYRWLPVLQVNLTWKL